MTIDKRTALEARLLGLVDELGSDKQEAAVAKESIRKMLNTPLIVKVLYTFIGNG